MEAGIPTAAIVIALVALLVTVFNNRTTARLAYVRSLEERVEHLELKLWDCEDAHATLLRENHELLSEIHDLRKAQATS